MIDPSFVLLYVADPTASAAFYAGILGREPVEASPTFVMFALKEGVMLGLWARHEVSPHGTAPGGAEIGFTVAGRGEVDATFAKWKERGMVIAQPPTKLDFGYTFVALDPDGHRLRVFVPEGP